MAQVHTILLLMIQILYDLFHQSCRNDGTVVYVYLYIHMGAAGFLSSTLVHGPFGYPRA